MAGRGRSILTYPAPGRPTLYSCETRCRRVAAHDCGKIVMGDDVLQPQKSVWGAGRNDIDNAFRSAGPVQTYDLRRPGQPFSLIFAQRGRRRLFAQQPSEEPGIEYGLRRTV